MKYSKRFTIYTFTVALLGLMIFTTGCSIPEKYAEPVSENNIGNDLGLNGTQMRLYLQVNSVVKSILPWEHFLKFKNYDIIATDTGEIKAATIQAGITVLPEQVLRTTPFLDAVKMGYDGGIFLCCTDRAGLITRGIRLSNQDTTINSFSAYNLARGLTFRFSPATPTPVKADFELWGVSGGKAAKLSSERFSFTFYNVQHTTESISQFGSVPAADLALSTTRDSMFTTLFSELKSYDSTARAAMYSKVDSIHVTKCEYCPEDSARKGIAVVSSYNANLLLAQRLIKRIQPGYTFPTVSPGGAALTAIPPVGPQLDDYLCFYSNISGLLDVLDDFKEGYTPQKDNEDDQLQKNLKSYLEKVVCNGNLGALSPSSFSRLILAYTDYLFYAGLCSYIDNDFFSRYINHHKLLVDQVKALVDKVAPEYNHNNIIIRFYAVAAFYDFLLNKTGDNLKTLADYLTNYVDSTGEYGEGYAYLNYTSDIVLPVVYLGLQEQYLTGSRAGQTWLADTSRLTRLYRAIGGNLINVASNWGELPAIDDGPPAISYLAPFAVINNQMKYLQYARDVNKLVRAGMYDSLERAERAEVAGNEPWKMLLYPYNRTIAGSSVWRNSLDSVRHVGSIVLVPTGSATDNLNMTIIAEEHPEKGGSHDAIDHGAIQFMRFTNNATGNRPHMDHLIIDPGYPGFNDNKRYLKEWQYCNQNVQMLWDSAFAFFTDETEGESSVASEEPEKNAEDEELLGYIDGKDFHTAEKFNYKENGGMTGYRYMSPWDMREIIHDYVLRDGGLQNNMWEIVDADAMMKIKAKALSHKGGEGKSSVVNRFRNGAEVRVDYKYPKEQEIFKFKERAGSKRAQFYYTRNIRYESSHYGIRGVYTLGNSYFVVDHLPETSLPSTIRLAASWNMPKNTSALGTTGWRRFVFEGTTPDTNTTFFNAQSRIELAVAGANNIETIRRVFQTGKALSDTIATQHITFENTRLTKRFMLAMFRICNAADTLMDVSTQLQDTATIAGGLIWKRTYTDNSIDLMACNPSGNNRTVENITSNADVWLLHADGTGRWISGRLFGAAGSPTFGATLPGARATAVGGTNGTEVQYELTF